MRKRRLIHLSVWMFTGVSAVLVSASIRIGGAANETQSPAASSSPAPLTFAVIGDYGVCGTRSELGITCAAEKAVAALVHQWNPAAIFTTGDNTHSAGSAEEIAGDLQPYDDYISAGKFFPSLGNHDWDSRSIEALLAHFRLSSPYYKKEFPGLLTAYMLDTNPQDPAGDSATSAQARWLAGQVAASTTPWNVVFNHPPLRFLWAPLESGLQVGGGAGHRPGVFRARSRLRAPGGA